MLVRTFRDNGYVDKETRTTEATDANAESYLDRLGFKKAENVLNNHPAINIYTLDPGDDPTRMPIMVMVRLGTFTELVRINKAGDLGDYLTKLSPLF